MKNVIFLSFALCLMSSSALAETSCREGYDRKVSHIGNVEVVRCVAKKASPPVCQTVVTSGGFERRCYKQRQAYTISSTPPSAYKKPVKKMSADELLDSLQKKASVENDPDVNRAIELLNLLEEGKKRTKSEKDNRLAKR